MTLLYPWAHGPYRLPVGTLGDGPSLTDLAVAVRFGLTLALGRALVLPLTAPGVRCPYCERSPDAWCNLALPRAAKPWASGERLRGAPNWVEVPYRCGACDSRLPVLMIKTFGGPRWSMAGIAVLPREIDLPRLYGALQGPAPLGDQDGVTVWIEARVREVFAAAGLEAYDDPEFLARDGLCPAGVGRPA